MEITISVKMLLIAIGVIITVGCYIWGDVSIRRDSGYFSALGGCIPVFVWLLSIIVLLICWIIFTK